VQNFRTGCPKRKNEERLLGSREKAGVWKHDLATYVCTSKLCAVDERSPADAQTGLARTRKLVPNLTIRTPTHEDRDHNFYTMQHRSWKPGESLPTVGCKDNLGRLNYLATYLRCLFRCYAGDERGTAADRRCLSNQAVHACSQKKEEKNRAVHFWAFYSLWKKSISMQVLFQGLCTHRVYS
jgi:hypothetical protein